MTYTAHDVNCASDALEFFVSQLPLERFSQAQGGADDGAALMTVRVDELHTLALMMLEHGKSHT
jgi:hypothetical protein